MRGCNPGTVQVASQFPFAYNSTTGAPVRNGNLDQSGAVCVLKDAHCDSSQFVASGKSCCSFSQDIDIQGISNLFLWGFIACFFVVLRFFSYWLHTVYPQSEEAANRLGKPFKKEHVLRTIYSSVQTKGQQSQNNVSGMLIYIFYVGYVSVLNIGSIFLTTSIQTTLSPAQLTANTSASAFLTPFAEVLSFVEDTMQVRCNYAISAGKYKQLRTLVKTGVYGGALMGVLGASIITLLTYIPEVFEPLCNPEGGSNAALYPGCGPPLLPDSSQQVSLSRSFWLLTAWEWVSVRARHPKWHPFVTRLLFNLTTRWGNGHLVVSLASSLVCLTW
jgi:hypothetical protein